MLKRRKTLLFVLSLAALLILLVTAARDDEPTYEGHSLQYWLKIHQGRGTADVTPEEAQQAKEAVRRIGTNALPFLLKWIAYEPYNWQKRLVRAIYRLPRPASSSTFSTVLYSPTYNRTKHKRAMLAHYGFQILGEEAAPAIPQLVALLHATNSVYPRERAANALAFIGRSGLPPLIDALSDTNFPARSIAASAIYLMDDLGTNASPAIPVLVRCIQNGDPSTATLAVQALGNLRIEPETVVPALTNAFAAKDREVRYAAVHAFWWLSDHANQAAPALRGMLNDPDYRVREDASNILARLATQAVTNPPAQ